MNNRPVAAVILAIISVFAGLLAVVDVLRYLGILPFITLGPNELAIYSTSIIGAILAGIVALIWFATAQRLWSLDERGWLFVLVIGVMNLIFVFVGLLDGRSFESVLPLTAISLLAIVLAWLPGTRAAFGQK
jgi:hypothetical protein